ncbi:MAG TPA: hypothetical protein VKB79_28245 [Bryobacteraceae bacterium]|nr:hypothetical protein [Bryobacteraceae bacterium]
MKLLVALTVMGAGTFACASGSGQRPDHLVMVCLNPGGNAAAFLRGEAAATQILKQANIRLQWRGAESNCSAGNGLVVTVSSSTPEDLHPGALAYALPFEGTHIVLFYDRVLSSVGASTIPALLGHVLAHEIVHILEGVNLHSASGVMKERWNIVDYVDMRRGGLKFTRDDIELIDRGMESRAAHSVRPDGQRQ